MTLPPPPAEAAATPIDDVAPTSGVETRASDGFVGRVNETKTILAWMRRSPVTLLFGARGVGKTRLARAIAEREGGIVCDVSRARSPRELESVVARSARGSRVNGHVVVLDGMLDPSPANIGVVRGWARALPERRFLITTWRRASIEGVACFEVPRLDPSAAWSLLHDRVCAQLGRPLHRHERKQAKALVEALDRLPLALELAAARTATMALGEILQHDDVLAALEPWPHAGSLQSRVDEVWRTLDPLERVALVGCARFRSPFTVEAAERVVACDAGARASRPIAAALRGLFDRCLVRRVSPSPSGAARFETSRVVRAFAARQAIGETRAAEDAYVDYWAEWSRSAEATHERTVRAVQDDLLEAFHRACARGDDASAAHLGSALRCAFFARPAAETNERVFTVAADAAARAQLPELEFEILQHVATFHATSGANRRARRAQVRAVAVARALGDRRRESLAVARLGCDCAELGEIDAGREHMEQAATIAAATSNVVGEAYAHNRLGVLRANQGDGEGAHASLLHARALAEASGDAWMKSKALLALASFARRRGDTATLARVLRQARPLAASDEIASASLALHEGALLRARGELDRAAAVLAGAARTAHRIGAARLRARALIERAQVCLDRGELGDARALNERALRIAVRIDNASSEAIALRQLAWIEMEDGSADASRDALVGAHTQAKARGDRMLEAEILLDLGVHATLERDVVEAVRRLEEACAIASSFGGPVVALAAAVLARIHPTDAARWRAQAEIEGRRISHAEIRKAVRLLLRSDAERGDPSDSALHRRVALVVAATSMASPDAPEVIVDEACEWFEVRGRRVRLASHAVLRAVLCALVRRHAAGHDEPLSPAETFRIVWGSEPADALTVRRRVYTVIRRLRSLGLNDAIRTADGGYLLDDRLRLEIARRSS